MATASTSNDAPKQRNVSIMSEQLMLVKTERELLQMIERINVECNNLLVEELQLKSNEIGQLEDANNDQHILPDVAASVKLDSTKLDSATEINRQILELGAYECTFMCNEDEGNSGVEDEGDD